MIIGIITLSLVMPILLDLDDLHKTSGLGYWSHQVPESILFVSGFWLVYRHLIILSRKYFPSTDDAKKRLFFLLLTVLLSAPILKTILGACSDLFLTLINEHNHIMPGHLTLLVNIYLPSLTIISIYEAIYYFFSYQQALIDREKLETQHYETQLTNLRNQINPHFLFNSLNTLMNLIPTDPDRATQYLSKLSKFYRYAVSERDDKLIPLSKEIEFAHLYADLLEERFHNALDVNINVPQAQGFLIPPLTLQLLIENAVKHNVVSTDEPLELIIKQEEDDSGNLIVKNNIQKKINAVSSTGLGLKNIKKRFALFTTNQVVIDDDHDIFQVSLPLISETQQNVKTGA